MRRQDTDIQEPAILASDPRVFAPLGDKRIGVQIAGASAPMWLERAHLAEYHLLMLKALDWIDAVATGAHEEMALRAAFGISLIFTKGMVEEARRQPSIDHGLWLYEARAGNFKRSLAVARRISTVAARFRRGGHGDGKPDTWHFPVFIGRFGARTNTYRASCC